MNKQQKAIEILRDTNIKDLKQRVVNTLVEVEIFRVEKRFTCDGNDHSYRVEQARLFNILQDEFSRGDIDKLLKLEVLKLIKQINTQEELKSLEHIKNSYGGYSAQQLIVNFIFHESI